MQRLRTLAREALDELRSLILGLRPPELERDGLAGALRKEVEMLRRVHGVEIELEADGTRRTVAPRRPTPARASRCCGSRTRRSTTRCATRAPST